MIKNKIRLIRVFALANPHNPRSFDKELERIKKTIKNFFTQILQIKADLNL